MDIQNNSKRLNILLIEDDEVDVMNVERSFSKNGIQHNLEVVTNGKEALEFLQTSLRKPDVILLDINLPGMSGLEILAAMRQDPALQSIMVFIMSTSDDAEDRNRAFTNHVAGYIVKPLSARKFNDIIVRLNKFLEVCAFPAQM